MKKLFALSLVVLILLSGTASPITAQDTAANALNNLYDFYQSAGYRVEKDGNTTVDSALSSNGSIPVTGGKNVCFGPCTKGSVHLATYDKNGNFIAKATDAECTVYDTLKDGKVIYTYPLPEHASYVWTAAENAVALDYLLTCDQLFGGNTLTEYHTLTPLTGKSALFVGDSICHGTNDSVADHYGWAGRIGDANDMDWINNGQSGYSVSTCRQNRPGIIIDKLLATKDRDFDYVLLHGGVNDAWDSVAIGTITKGFDPSKFNKATFAGGLENLFYHAYLYYGDTAAIGYLINFSMPTAGQLSLREMKPYFDLAKKICDKWEVRYFDMFENTKVFSDMKIGTNLYTPDYIHPNAAGYDILAPMIEGFMETLEQKNMPDGKIEDDGTIYEISFLDENGTSVFSTTATASKGLNQSPDYANVTDDGIVKRQLRGWNFAGRIYPSFDYYQFSSDATFRAVYTDYYGARFEDCEPVKIPTGAGAELTSQAISLLPENVALGQNVTGITLVYRVEGADEAIIADDFMISRDTVRQAAAWQWGDHLYRKPNVASPNNLTLENGCYYLYLNENITGSGSTLCRMNIFNKHQTYFYNELTVREPVNTNQNATFQLLAVTPNNLQPVVTFHDAQGEVIATYQHKYTDISKHLGYAPGGIAASYQGGELLTVENAFAKTKKDAPQKSPTHGGKVTYEFSGWVDKDGNKVEGIYYNCDFYPSYQIVTDERTEFTVTYLNGEKTHATVKVKDGDPSVTSIPQYAGDPKPFTKYVFAGWTDPEGNAIDLTSVTADITVYASYTEECEHNFPDIEEGRFYTDSVEWALMSGIMNGEGTKFNPSKATTRAMIVTVLYRIEGSPDVSEVEPPFTDITESTWYYDAIKWAYSKEVVKGLSATTFAPTGVLTREQFATVLYRYAKEIRNENISVEKTENLDAYTDQSTVSAYALDAVLWANVNGYIGGTSATTLSPKGSATRAQMATILYRYIVNERK